MLKTELDTLVVVRVLTDDLPDQAARAAHWLAGCRAQFCLATVICDIGLISMRDWPPSTPLAHPVQPLPHGTAEMGGTRGRHRPQVAAAVAQGPVTLSRAKLRAPAGKVYFTSLPVISTKPGPVPSVAEVHGACSVSEVSTTKWVP